MKLSLGFQSQMAVILPTLIAQLLHINPQKDINSVLELYAIQQKRMSVAQKDFWKGKTQQSQKTNTMAMKVIIMVMVVVKVEAVI